MRTLPEECAEVPVLREEIKSLRMEVVSLKETVAHQEQENQRLKEIIATLKQCGLQQLSQTTLGNTTPRSLSPRVSSLPSPSPRPQPAFPLFTEDSFRKHSGTFIVGTFLEEDSEEEAPLDFASPRQRGSIVRFS